MSAQDAMFLHVENDVTPMHIGGVSIFEGPPPAFADLTAMVAGKLDHTPRYRQKVRFVPFGLSEPVWVDDSYFDLSYHLRHTAVPAPGSESQLRAMAARVFSQHLDRARPLWEIWMVEGLSHGRWALLSKVHHCMVDGVAATDLMSVMFDDAASVAGTGAAGTGSPEAEHWAPGPEPSGAELLVRGVASRAIDPASQLRSALSAWPQVLASAASTVRALTAAAPALRPATTSLTGSIGPHRTWSWAKVSLPEVKRMRQALGGTVNDIVLTVITNGFRNLLDERGEAMPRDRVVRTMVPVSVRRPGEQGVYNNRVSAVFARLPVGLEDPAARLADIRGQMDGIKASKQAVAGDVLAQLSGFAPPLLLALGSRVMTRSARLNMDTATTNVPGPQTPVRALGRRLLESYPYVPIVGTIRIVVAIFSYDGQLYFGVTGDRDHAPDVDVLTAGIESGAAALAAGAEPLPPPRRIRSSRARSRA
ncbi:MAG TPA: wax ester/triacylglycerol synthase family O-acyltransferase [Solirubrobacteraceae bacterium]|jgi:WS/DGAT/MGAT family acyltransferase|nr:wax ester/triacylglycerol synthase family O-acyltransferase [Solirubrobacteraceae bacterium]